VNPLALLLLGQASLVAVRPGSDVVCPSPAQINGALSARLPGLVVRADQAAAVDALIVELAPGRDGALDLRLVGGDGTSHLSRELSTKDGTEDCAALADTVALIVERFVVEVDDRGARAAELAARAAGRRWDLAIAGGWRSGGDADGGLQALARVDRLFGQGPRFQVSLAAGVGASADPVPARTTYPGHASLRRMPVELGLWWLRALEPGELQLGVTGGLEITKVSARWETARRDDLFPGPFATVAAGLRFPVGDYAFLRLTGGLGLALVKYDFTYSDDPDTARMTVFTAPGRRFYAKIAGELGISLPLMKKRSAGP
jgi:hypothetical protein